MKGCALANCYTSLHICWTWIHTLPTYSGRYPGEEAYFGWLQKDHLYRHKRKHLFSHWMHLKNFSVWTLPFTNPAHSWVSRAWQFRHSCLGSAGLKCQPCSTRALQAACARPAVCWGWYLPVPGPGRCSATASDCDSRPTTHPRPQSRRCSCRAALTRWHAPLTTQEWPQKQLQLSLCSEWGAGVLSPNRTDPSSHCLHAVWTGTITVTRSLGCF